MRHATAAADAAQEIVTGVEYPLVCLLQRTIGIAAERAVNAHAFVVPALQRLGFLRQHHTKLRSRETAGFAFVPGAIDAELIDIVVDRPASSQHHVSSAVGS